MSDDTDVLSRLIITDWLQSTFWQAEIHAHVEVVREAMGSLDPLICQGISSEEWRQLSPNGYSARMFLHLMNKISVPHWKVSDTEQSLLKSMRPVLRVNKGSGISLSDVLKRPGCSELSSKVPGRSLKAIIRRALRRGRSLRILLVTEQDTTPVTVIFSTEQCDSWMVKSVRPLPDFLRDGLLECLKDAWLS